MGFFRWGEGKPSSEPDAHETAHHKVGKKLGLDGYWWNDGGRARYAQEGWDSRKLAIAVAAGCVAGGGDSREDEAEARVYCREAGISFEEAKAEARRLL